MRPRLGDDMEGGSLALGSHAFSDDINSTDIGSGSIAGPYVRIANTVAGASVAAPVANAAPGGSIRNYLRIPQQNQ